MRFLTCESQNRNSAVVPYGDMENGTDEKLIQSPREGLLEESPNSSQLIQFGLDETCTGETDHPTILLSDLADDPEVADLLHKFLGNVAAMVDRIQASASAKQLDQIVSLSHQLKGAGGGYGYPSITDAARKVEKLAKANQDLDQLRLAVVDLSILCQRAIAGRSSLGVQFANASSTEGD